MPHSKYNVDDFLQLDLAALRAHTEAAGDQIDHNRHRDILCKSLSISKVCEVRRSGSLVAYAVLRPDTKDCWFVGAFNIHPDHRTPGIFLALAASFLETIKRHSVLELRSNVYRSNLKSVALHRRLGFIATKENAKGIEFRGSVLKILETPVCRRWERQIFCSDFD